MKICLVAPELPTASREEDAGLAASHLAILMAANRHAVTLLHAGEAPVDPRDPWALLYEVAGIAVRHCPPTEADLTPPWMKPSVEIFQQLRDAAFDLVLFADRRALGHASIVAKRTGLAFAATVLAVIAHGSTPWLLEANRKFLWSPEHLALAHMERQAIELADAVVSPSHHLLDWMRSAGWTLPRNARVIPNFRHGAALLGAEQPSPGRTLQRPAHLVFFGPLEERRGIDLFLQALLSEDLKALRFRLTFLGRDAPKSVDDIRCFVATHRPELLSELQIETNLSTRDALDFLSSTDAVAIMPSLIDNAPGTVTEALAFGIPFVATASDRNAELVRAEDRERCLVAPTVPALARKLREVLSAEAWESARPACDQREAARRWLTWFQELQTSGPAVAKPFVAQDAADVTVVVTHFERPSLAQQNLRALAAQSCRSFEVIMVDDGSESEAALAFLDRVEQGAAGLPVQVVRQSNKYLGAARNEGLRHVNTPFVIFLDDDNIAFPNMVEVFRRAAHTSGADIITCQMQLFADPIGEPDPRVLMTGERWAFSGGPAALGAHQNCFGDATAIYRRDLFERIGYFHEVVGVGHEDWQLHLRTLLEGGSLLSLPVPLFWYRRSPGSMIMRTSMYDNMRVIASALQQKLPVNLSPMVELLIGMKMAE